MISAFEVSGHSMEPSLSEGDRILVWKTRKLRQNDIAVFHAADRLLVKRVQKGVQAGFRVTGGNEAHSDSRFVPSGEVIGKVIFRY
ncbi:S24/S26 family peptidase [Candidatus Woesearchaeota archaeon]|nr:S24/S26 family peptidase [Candidatus Woesearchaeota archaeon]